MSAVAIILFLVCSVFSAESSKNLTFSVVDQYEENYLHFLVQEFDNRDIKLCWEEEGVETFCNITWCASYTPNQFSALQDFQRINNFPSLGYITGKDRLNKVVKHMRSIHGDDTFSFWPRTYNLDDPKEFNEFRNIYKRRMKQNITEPLIYIIKQPKIPRGGGVHLVSNLGDVNELLLPTSKVHPILNTKPIAQEYVTDVLTLQGHKVTLRIYAVITSLDPLRVYVFYDGLVRICSKEYTTNTTTLSDLYVHIDSYDINHVNEDQFEERVAHSDLEHEGLRVTVSHLLKRLEAEGKDGKAVWESIKEVVGLSFVGGETRMLPWYLKFTQEGRKRRLYPFEMVGFDILIDKNMKAWVLEINNTPSLVPHTTLENAIKEDLVHDLFDLVDIENKQFDDIPRITEEKWAILQSLPKDTKLRSSKTGAEFEVRMFQSKNDVWAVVETELEGQRLGKFQRIFPEPENEKWVKFLTNPRNDFVMKWIKAGMSISDIKSS